MMESIEDEEIRSCLMFAVKADALKNVLRKTKIVGGGRNENTAEHSWHIALMAAVLARCANKPLDINRVIIMLLLHDLGEIGVGDTPLYDPMRSQAQTGEEEFVKKLFSALPSDLGKEFLDLWMEFAAGKTPEARFARAMDRLQPFLCNLENNGGSWRELKITKDMALDKNKSIQEGSEALWQLYRMLAEKADEQELFWQG
jgi:putative hydrolases of HD superfamily